jgi:hypothetical protein
MAADDVSQSAGGPVWCWRALAAFLIAGAAALHVLYLANDCPLDLAPDEAHYWDWSRHLDWSYYSKGPLVAYLIRAGTALAGPVSQRLTASDMLAVRLPAVLCGAFLLLSLYVLTVQVFGREGLATAVVAAALTLPAVAAGSSLMTIDAPYTCCWGWALVLGHRAVFRGSGWAWPAAGFVVGLGILAKYTMVLWLPSLGLFLLTTPQYRRLLVARPFWLLVGVAAGCCVPILVWNLQHGWVTFLHVGGQAGLRDTPGGVRWLGPLTYVGVQCALLLGYWFVAWVAAMTAHRPWRETDAGACYLWWMSAPMFAGFWLFSLKTAEEPNWPVAAYISGLVLTAAWLARQFQGPPGWYRRLLAGGMVTACALGLALTGVMHFSAACQPVLRAVSGPASPTRPLPLRRFDPTCRLRGWRPLAAEVDRLREALRAEGVEPVLAGAAWTLPGELGFYCAGRPQVYSLGLAAGDRHSQYDLWRPNPVQDWQQFAGRTFVFVGDVSPTVRAAFEQVETPRLVLYQERGQPIAAWNVTICRGFRGFGQSAGLAQGTHY